MGCATQVSRPAAAPAALAANPLVERAVLGLLRIAQRLLPYKEDTADTLLRSLSLVGALSRGAARDLAETIAKEVWQLASSHAVLRPDCCKCCRCRDLVSLAALQPHRGQQRFGKLSMSMAGPSLPTELRFAKD
jgi:brefeldin A-resistance guanine nucleotide exchange factor 1